jgi:serine/threonine protein kinase
MAPEQARGEIDRVDERSDVFGLGAILHFLLNGRGPGEGATAAGEIAMPRALAAICAKAMSAEPADRYAGTQEMAADVARYLDGLPVRAYPENIFQKAGRLLARHRVAVILILAYVTVRLLLLFLLKR